jgi:two-component system, NarL family, nitrate/nitrite response regulator NarL
LICRLLETIGVETREASNRDDALVIARREHPPLVIVDVALPPLSGYEVCRELRDIFAGTIAIIFVSDDRIEPRDRAAGLYLGADDYVAKPFDVAEFLARISRFLSRFERGPQARGAATDLTFREQEVLRLLARGLSQSAIARELVISPKTVSNHIQNVLQKLGAHSRAEAVALAYQLGLTPQG